MNKNIIAAIAAATISTTALSSVYMNGNYEGTISDGTGAATYTQDLDLTLVGSNDAGTNVTAMFENLTGGSAVTATQVFIETNLEGIDFKGGNYKGQNGAGLMQQAGLVTNQMEAGFNVAGTGLTLGQASGDGNVTVDTRVSVADISVKVQNVTDDARFVTLSTTLAGLDVNGEYQKTTTGTNMGGSIGTNIAGLDVTGVMIDVEDTAGVTQEDGILGDISDAQNGKTVKGVVVSTGSDLGSLTGKYINKNDQTTLVGELERGAFTFGYSKTENTDGVATAKINVAF